MTARPLRTAGLFSSFLSAWAPGDRDLLLRQAFLCLAALLAVLPGSGANPDPTFIWTAALIVFLNLAASLLAVVPAFVGTCRCISCLLGLVGWTALASLTGGAASPYSLGFVLEILLCGLRQRPAGILLVTGGGILGLGVSQAAAGLSSFPVRFGLESLLLAAIGGLASTLVRRWHRERRRLEEASTNLAGMLRQAEMALEQSRPLMRIGEETARMAHTLKNAAGNARAYCSLIEEHSEASGPDTRAVEGLRRCVDRLERLSLDTLRGSPAAVSASPPCASREIRQAIGEAIEQVRLLHPGVRWACDATSAVPSVDLPPEALREMLILIAQNAAEAQPGGGDVAVHARSDSGCLRIEIRDSGPGIPEAIRDRLFEPGVTTKETGTGFGLFLVRRQAESHGGSLTAAPAPEGGTTVTLMIPAHGL